MRFDDFERLVRRLAGEVPGEFLEGVVDIEVSGKTLPHPARAEIYTLGECIPLPAEGESSAGGIQSRVVLYHGSFLALAHLDADFDWREEVWETLTHELRHHLEWRARAPDLEAFDRAAEQNFARADGEPFDPLFYLDAERVADGVFRIDDDFFLDREVDRRPAEIPFDWHGAGYLATVPETTLPLFLTLIGVSDPPPGDLILVLRQRTRLRDLFRGATAPVSAEAQARPRGE
jgi:predicted Zn-dependent protease with MMP-like domain